LRAPSGKGTQQRLRVVQHFPITKNNLVANSVCEEVADLCCDLSCMGLEREVARVEEMDYGTKNIAPERLGTARR
jgi:hypothetical protein